MQSGYQTQSGCQEWGRVLKLLASGNFLLLWVVCAGMLNAAAGCCGARTGGIPSIGVAVAPGFELCHIFAAQRSADDRAKTMSKACLLAGSLV